jgi:hypothetical protein
VQIIAADNSELNGPAAEPIASALNFDAGCTVTSTLHPAFC